MPSPRAGRKARRRCDTDAMTRREGPRQHRCRCFLPTRRAPGSSTPTRRPPRAVASHPHLTRLSCSGYPRRVHVGWRTRAPRSTSRARLIRTTHPHTTPTLTFVHHPFLPPSIQPPRPPRSWPRSPPRRLVARSATRRFAPSSPAPPTAPASPSTAPTSTRTCR